MPKRAELDVVAKLIWKHLHGGRGAHGAYSPLQLATRISMLRDSTDIGEMVDIEASARTASAAGTAPTRSSKTSWTSCASAPATPSRGC